ncbi:MAG: response regulator [Bacteroidetes bacterium]|nr:response regulator [Bacteroidota bacterium]
MSEQYNVLYVDDEEANLRMFRSIFRRDFNILTAKSGLEGLQILEKEKRIHLIITDERMPGMTGLKFLEEVHKRMPGKSPYKMIVSGYAKSADIKHGIENHHLNDFVSKPWDENDLKSKMLQGIKESEQG